MKNYEAIFQAAIEEIAAHAEIKGLKDLQFSGYEISDKTVVASDMAAYIDHTVLKPDTPQSKIETLCEEALKYQFASICINPCWINLAVEKLKGKIKVCTVVGFPLGSMAEEAKAEETCIALESGAEEIDMVINVGFIKTKKYQDVYEEIKLLKDICSDVTLKVILETCLLTEEEKAIASILCRAAGANFVKTSTGFSTGGATAMDILLMKNMISEKMEVKASGGVRDYQSALTMIQHGATRIGSSSGASILSQ